MKKGGESLLRKIGFLPIFLILIILGFAVFVFAGLQTSMPAYSTYNEDVYNLYNITLNTTDSLVTGNITQVNITLPPGFTFLYKSNRTSINSTATITIVFTNTSSVLSWSNSTTAFINDSAVKNEFSFNASAANPGNYNFTVVSVNYTTVHSTNVSVYINDTTAPDVHVSNISSLTDGGNYSGTLSLNVSLVDVLVINKVYFNITTNGTTYQKNMTYLSNTSVSAWNATFDTTSLTDGFYNVTVWANDSNGNTNNSATVSTVRIDNTVPTASATCTSSTVGPGDTFPCSCSGTDAGSGVSTAVGSSTSPDGTSTPASTGTFTYTCTVTDRAGKSAIDTESYTVSGSGTTSSGGGGGGTTTATNQKTHQWTVINSGAAVVMQNFDSSIGLKQIEITVNNQAQNVKITVTKYDSKPAEVSVEKTGKVYKYLEINAQNLENELNRARITAQVQKTWVSSNSVNQEDLALFKFDNSSSKWIELATSLTEEDDTYYYYEADVTSFSYFAIGEKISEVPITGEGEEGEIEGEEEGGLISTSLFEGNLLWLWIAIGVVVVAGAVVGMILIKKKKQ